jgi:putative transposase
MQYRRANATGATYFITANLANRRETTLTDHIDVLREALRRVKASHPFDIEAMVVLPDHFHLLMTLPSDDANFSLRIGAIKSAFSRRLPKTELIRPSRETKRERGIWQRRFWEHLIRDDRDFANHVNYIHINPVNHGLVTRAADWPHSTIHHFIKRGLLDENWATSIDDGDYGEGKCWA